MKHPLQKIYKDQFGVHRFRSNAIIDYLFNSGKLNLNEIAATPGFSKEDRQQLAQLLGYSVSGYSDLSYVTDKAWARANKAEQKFLEKEKEKN